jgi:hypothetical protein
MTERTFSDWCDAEIEERRSYLASLQGAGGSAALGGRECGAREYRDTTAREIANLNEEIARLEAAKAEFAGL